MKIKMKTIVAGPDISAKPEQILEVGVDISKERAKAFVNGGYAEYCANKQLLKTEKVKESVKNLNDYVGVERGSVLTFGDHKGKSLGQIPDKYLTYLSGIAPGSLKKDVVMEIKLRKSEKSETEKPESTSIETRETTSKVTADSKAATRKDRPRKTVVRKPDSDN